MDDLRKQLEQADADGARTKLIVTDGVFSMDGYIAKLDEICSLADEFSALVMVDDCHATGFMGSGGKGAPAHCGVAERVDILTGTLGKALGGGMGGYICATKEVVHLLRNRARPYLFSNALTPALLGATLKTLELVRDGDALRAQLFPQCHALPNANDGGRFYPPPRRAPNHSGDDPRCAAGGRNGGRHDGRRRLRHRLFLSGRAKRAVTHPHPDVRRPY